MCLCSYWVRVRSTHVPFNEEEPKSVLGAFAKLVSPVGAALAIQLSQDLAQSTGEKSSPK